MNANDKKARQREYVRKHYERQKADGKVKAMFWLEPEANAAIETAMKLTGQNKEEVMNKALVLFAERLQLQRQDELRDSDGD